MFIAEPSIHSHGTGLMEDWAIKPPSRQLLADSTGGSVRISSMSIASDYQLLRGLARINKAWWPMGNHCLRWRVIVRESLNNLCRQTQWGDEALNETIKEAKERVLNWLKEEVFSPEEMSDPNAYFNIGIKFGGLDLHVVQDIRSTDSVQVRARLSLTEAQLGLLKDNMNEKRRQEFYWDLRLTLLGNNELGDFEITPNPPNDVRQVFITSRRIYYDALTKDRLVSAVSAVYKALVTVIWMLERYAGAIAPREGTRSFYR